MFDQLAIIQRFGYARIWTRIMPGIKLGLYTVYITLAEDATFSSEVVGY